MVGEDRDLFAIFDKAQRAWNREQTARFMQRKRGRAGFDLSEPEFLISCLDRHPIWAVVVCLVGSGQEINTGEASIAEWLGSVERRFPEWEVYVSPELGQGDATVAAIKAQGLTTLGASGRVLWSPEMAAAFDVGRLPAATPPST
jgi:hypothetical protein